MPALADCEHISLSFNVMGYLNKKNNMDSRFFFAFMDTRYGRDYHGMSMAFWAMTYTLSKVLQLGDTVFIVLRKKKLILLHWFVNHLIGELYIFSCLCKIVIETKRRIKMDYYVFFKN